MNIFYAGCYTRKEKFVQHLTNSMLCLIVCGFEYMNLYSSRKILLHKEVEIEKSCSYLLLLPPGIYLDFSTGENRENFVAMLDLPEMEYEENSLHISLHGTALHPIIKLNPNQMYSMREIFSDVVRNISCGCPGAKEKAKLQLFSLLAELIRLPDPGRKIPPGASALKEAIDKDIHFEYSVREWNTRLGYCSMPYMRKLFREAYGLTPGKYRNIQRMNRIKNLFAQSDLSLKMIADEVGMKHLPHLYAFLENEEGLSPKELMKQLRGRRKKEETK